MAAKATVHRADIKWVLARSLHRWKAGFRPRLEGHGAPVISEPELGAAASGRLSAVAIAFQRADCARVTTPSAQQLLPDATAAAAFQHALILQENASLFLSAFPVLVSSLSWQKMIFSSIKKGVFLPEPRGHPPGARSTGGETGGRRRRAEPCARSGSGVA